jgi:hypothetical protein
MESFADGANAERFAEDFWRVDRVIEARDPLAIHLAPGGGWVGWIRPEGSWSSSSAIRLSPSQIRTCGFPAYGSSRE